MAHIGGDPVHAGHIDFVPEYRDKFPTRGIPINPFGTRKAEASVPDRELVVCLGCSHTYGYTRASNSYAKELERLLGSPYQVLNMGRRNYGLKLCIDWYDVFAARLSPKWCVIQIPLFCRQPLPGIQQDSPESYTMGSGAWRYLLNCTDAQFWSHANSLIARDEERLREFLKRLNRDGVKPLVLAYRTDKHRLPLITPAQVQQYERLADVCREQSVPFVCGDEISNTGLGQRGMLFDETHPNEAGNRWLAFNIGQHIDSGMRVPRRTEVRNLAVDVRGFFRKWSPKRVRRKIVKRWKGKKAKESIPTDTYTLY